MRIFLTSVISLFWTQTAAAEDAVMLMAPSSKWNVNYQEHSCFLGRSFKGRDREIIVSFTQFAPGDVFNLRAFGRPFAAEGPFQNVRIAFGSEPAAEPLRDRLSGRSGEWPFVDLGNFTLTGPVSGSDEMRAPPVTRDDEAAITMLTIGPHKGRTYRLMLGSMRAPMDAMRKCTDSLLRHWGYDPAVISTLRSPPEPVNGPETWLGSLDYPVGMLAAGQLGGVEFRLDVDSMGAVTGCTVLRRAGDEAFAKVTCEKLMRRARFRPAQDAAGTSVRSFYINRVNWVIPK